VPRVLLVWGLLLTATDLGSQSAQRDQAVRNRIRPTGVGLIEGWNGVVFCGSCVPLSFGSESFRRRGLPT
jgi:hypothetical protein